MAAYKQKLVFEIANRLRTFVDLEIAFSRTPSRDETQISPDSSKRENWELRESLSKKDESLKQLRGWLSKKDERIESLRKKLASSTHQANHLEKPDETDHVTQRSYSLDPSRVVWIFGTGRGGSTWLRSMMSELENHRVWEEPMVGRLFGDFYHNAQKGQLQSKSFVMGEPARDGWIESVRVFLLDRISHLYPSFSQNHLLIVKEPNGSAGAPIIMEALPESRMILLVRDPRDVAASVMDATKQGSWMYERKSKGDWKQGNISDTEPDVMARRRARKYVDHVGNAKKAFEEHEGPKTLVRYEDLVSDTLGTMSRIYEDLGIEVDEQELGRAVEKHSWENIPEEKKGEGKFYRKGQPGGWREDLTEEQVGIVEEITGSLLKEFYTDEGFELSQEQSR